MPNWAITNYKFKGADESQAKDLYQKIEALNKMDKPFVENGFGKLWLGCVVNYLGGDYEKIYCRGEISSYDKDGDTVSMCCETAWDEMPEFRHFIESKYPGSKVYYQVEESGNLVYATNDRDGKYYPERYLLDMYDDNEYFCDLESVAKYVSGTIGKEVKPDVQAIETAIDEYMAEHPEEENWMSFHVFEVCDD